MPEPIRAGIIGMGFMGQTHARAYAAARAAGRPVRLAAVADPDPARRAGSAASEGNLAKPTPTAFDAHAVTGYERAAELIADPEIDLVSICTYTDTHADLAVRALEAGKHVVVEKPVGLTLESVARVAAAAAKSGRLCMPAMCMRFWPAWRWLRDQIHGGSLGPVRTAVFQRLGSAPAWAPEFYGDTTRSGGALFDLHIHDADFVLWCFGPPDAVTCAGNEMHLSCTYHYSQGPELVHAEGGWGQIASFGFRMRYVINFATATADFDLHRPDPLILHSARGSSPVPLIAGDGYEHELAHIIDAIAAGRTYLDATPQDALDVTRLLLAERRSLTQRGRTSFDPA